MIGPSSSRAGRAQRNRWISPRQVQILHALWSARLRRAGRRPRPERSREERLRHFAEIVGHAIGSCRELSWREANRVIHQLLEEVRSSGPTPSSSAAEELEPAAASEARSASVKSGGPPSDASRPKGGPSDAQLWKIRRMEQSLGWGQPGKDERRLAGFLRVKFHVKQPEELSADSVSRAIEALCAAGARARIKARKGKSYAVKRPELAREIAALKQELHEWRPTQS